MSNNTNSSSKALNVFEAKAETARINSMLSNLLDIYFKDLPMQMQGPCSGSYAAPSPYMPVAQQSPVSVQALGDVYGNIYAVVDLFTLDRKESNEIKTDLDVDLYQAEKAKLRQLLITLLHKMASISIQEFGFPNNVFSHPAAPAPGRWAPQQYGNCNENHEENGQPKLPMLAMYQGNLSRVQRFKKLNRLGVHDLFNAQESIKLALTTLHSEVLKKQADSE